jgi:serine/threonine-protein phosphatase 2B catalytic subunit
MDIFSWSLPFVAEKLSELFLGMLKPGEHDNEYDYEEEHCEKQIEKKIPKEKENFHSHVLSEKGKVLMNKIKFVAKMTKFQKILR